MTLIAVLCLLTGSDAFTLGSCSRRSVGLQHRRSTAAMGLFDGLKAAFSNEEFREDDQRVRASHILVKGEDDVERIVALMGEIGERVGSDAGRLGPVFAEVARRESSCGSAAQGGDLGLFGPGKMVPEFDEVLFPLEAEPPPAGSLLGPIVTEFGCHVILVTKRDVNRDQVEKLLVKPLD
eukprot:CAMPEP_0119056334 /NCGR_PEP_ID=MMETSP1178-20130426/1020_1 /TAXON_ID=33656 /ORGANISM="unid sp, Strain CCMP2000" /LENGTH=179 /DNA_ID=CAMNT_0007037055 /DNA_START=12 /DNA_END=551 /DNA_ORIENTATION=-